jgi:AraC family transcriptional regulator
MRSDRLAALVSAPRMDPIDIVPDHIVLSSRPYGWPGMTVWLNQTRHASEVYVPPTTKHTVLVQLNAGAKLIQERGGQQHTGPWSEGDIFVVRAGQPSAWIAEGAVTNLHIDLEPAFVQRVALEDYELPPELVELHDTFSGGDRLVVYIGKLLLIELEMENMGGLAYVEQLVRKLVGHLLRTYSTYPPAVSACNVGLPPYMLHKVQDYIRAHLHRRITLSELAILLHLSVRHLSRLFKQSTGRTLAQYIAHCQMEHAQDLLRNPHLSMREIAARTGFHRQEHFTRRFHAYTGLTPTAYRGAQRTHGVLSRSSEHP